MNIPDRQVVCEVLTELALTDKSIVVLCSDSRGSGSMTPFARAFPEQFVEVGIAEQSLVSVAAGLAGCGKRPVAVSPASFLSTRSLEQIKVDCAYSHTNVKLLGISGGVSYGALGMTHHSASDTAAIASLPGMRVYLPSDRFQTDRLFRALMADDEPAYIRVGRNPVEDVYKEGSVPFTMDQATLLQEGGDLAILACGETVPAAKEAAALLAKQGIAAMTADVYCIKPLDRACILKAAKTGRILTVEEHVAIGGLGSQVAQFTAEQLPCRVKCLTLPDSPVIAGTSKEVFARYGLDAAGIVRAAKELLQ